jgi:class 3 adenylate cyclase
MSRSIQQGKGLVNKYIGDAIMAIFGILIEPEYQADHAAAAAVEMQKSLRILNEDLKKAGLPEIRTGIGIHKGKVLAGNIGSSSRMEYTVIGDTVNVASRIEGLTRYFANGVVISDEVRSGFKGIHDFNYRFLTRIRVKGRSTPVALFEVLDGLPGLEKDLKIKTASLFEAGVNSYFKKEFDEAQKIFLPLLRTLPDDKILLHYSHRCEMILKEGIPDHWDGIENS